MAMPDAASATSRARDGTIPARRRTARASGTAPATPRTVPRTVAGKAPLLAALCVALIAWACGPGGPPGDAGGGSDGGPDLRSDGEVASGASGGWRGVVLEEPVPATGFTLTDTRGRPFRFPDDAPGSVTLLFFGYTHCPDVCPVQMANLGAVLETLRPSVRKEISVVFVTVDPARDTAQRIRAWLDRHGEGFVGLRGPPGEVKAIQKRMGVAAAVLPTGAGGETGDAYIVGHASQVLAFTPDGKAHLAYPFGTRQRDWAADLRRLVREGWSPPGRD